MSDVVRNIQKWKRVESQIKSLVKEAKDILKESHFPTTSKSLELNTKKHKYRVTLEAELLIHAEHCLKNAIENDNAEQAASRMLSLCVAYERMITLRDVPEFKEWYKLGLDEGEVHSKSLIAGFKNLLGNKTKPNRVTESIKISIQNRANELRKESPAKLKKTIIYQLIEEFAGTPGASASYINKNIKIAKKSNK